MEPAFLEQIWDSSANLAGGNKTIVFLCPKPFKGAQLICIKVQSSSCARVPPSPALTSFCVWTRQACRSGICPRGSSAGTLLPGFPLGPLPRQALRVCAQGPSLVTPSRRQATAHHSLFPAPLYFSRKHDHATQCFIHRCSSVCCLLLPLDVSSRRQGCISFPVCPPCLEQCPLRKYLLNESMNEWVTCHTLKPQLWRLVQYWVLFI